MTPAATIEKHLKTQVEKLGGKCRKFVSPSQRGVSDRLVFLPNRVFLIAEVKAGNDTISPLQAKDHREMADLGFDVVILETKEDVDKMLSPFMVRDMSQKSVCVICSLRFDCPVEKVRDKKYIGLKLERHEQEAISRFFTDGNGVVVECGLQC